MTRIAYHALLPLGALLAAAPAAAQAPALRYDPPSGFAAGRGADGAQIWTAPSRDGVLVIYPFQSFRGDLERDFQQTLFRDRVAAAYREGRTLTTPDYARPSVGGADAAILAVFTGETRGAPRMHARIAILADGSVAVVDLMAGSVEAFHRHLQTVTPVFGSMHVLRAPPGRSAAVAGSSAAAAAVPRGSPATASAAGLFVAAKRMFRFGATGSPGSGSWETKNEWFLLSGDGRVQRGVDLPTSPNGDIRRFDYEGARRAEPGNGGAYTVRGSAVAIRLGGDSFDGVLNADGDLVINGTTY